jgi:uncharacterized protein YidB (DUF937 family)
MDELTKLTSSLGGETGQTDPTAALEGLTQAVQAAGGIDGIVAKLRSAGLGEAVDSWVSTGPNQPVDPARLGEALGPDTVKQLSAGAGVDAGQLLPMLAAFLPRIIDMLTPDGQVPSGGLGQAAGGLGGLGGLLGGLAGAAGAGGAGSGGTADVGAVLGELGGLFGGSKGS